jgi:hypothetical protein
MTQTSSNVVWTPWVAVQYGYEKFSISDNRGTEIGFVHRRKDADLAAAAPALAAAAERVLKGLSARIDAALPEAVPLFDGIAELHEALAKARGES